MRLMHFSKPKVQWFLKAKSLLIYLKWKGGREAETEGGRDTERMRENRKRETSVFHLQM